MRHRAAALVVSGVLACLACQGCGSTYEDPATGIEAKYRWDTLTAELDQEIGMVYPAAQQAADELDLKVLREAMDGIAGEIRALDAHLDTVDIRLEAMPAGRTLMTIRIGAFGARNKSAVVFEHVMGNLTQY